MTLAHHRTSLVVLTTAFSLVASAALAAPTGNIIKALDIDETSDQTIVSIKAKTRPTFTVFKLTNPPRLFIDVVSGDVSGLESTTHVGNGVITRLVAQQFQSDLGPVGRIVVEFDQDATYDIKTKGTTVELRVDGTARTRPDLKLKAAQREAKRLQQAIARERALLKELKASRQREEKLKDQAEQARTTEEQLVERGARARKESQRLSNLAKAESDKLTDDLMALKAKSALELIRLCLS